MVFSELLLKIPYSITWRLANSSLNAFPVVFYCTNYIDFLVFEPIRKYLPELTIVAKNRSVQNTLFEKGVSSILWPVYPKVVLMARHSLHMFPSNKIIKIGMRHGAYNFKKFINSTKYNRFNLFLFTSESELETAKNLGISNGEAIGFPKIDELHNNSITKEIIRTKKNEIGFEENKKVILFSATWNKSSISAIEKWYEKLEILIEDYNVLVTVHPFTEANYISKIKNMPSVYFIENENINIYLAMADLLVGDTSSLIGEFCSLNKPIITFEIEERGRLNPEIIEMLNDISFRVNSFKDLCVLLPRAFENKNLHEEQRKKHTSIMFTNLNGFSGKIAANKIADFIRKEGISF
jgi:CDP-glycerol glycerophosphotransferase (TagB/SpsB family)